VDWRQCSAMRHCLCTQGDQDWKGSHNSLNLARQVALGSAPFYGTSSAVRRVRSFRTSINNQQMQSGYCAHCPRPFTTRCCDIRVLGRRVVCPVPNDILITNNGDESNPSNGIILNDKCVYAWYNEQVSVSGGLAITILWSLFRTWFDQPKQMQEFLLHCSCRWRRVLSDMSVWVEHVKSS
jgi:hypothetical protein